MEYYITPSAKGYYPTPIDQTVWIADDHAMNKLKVLFNDITLGKFCNQSEQLDLPVVFITNEDLGKKVPKNNLIHVNKRYNHRRECESVKGLELPECVVIPDEKQFRFINIDNIFKNLDKLGDSKNLNNPNLGLPWRKNESVASSDWLGIYQSIGQSRFIFIRIDEIMREPMLNNSIGVASVVIHELGHAIMDPRMTIKLKFREILIYPPIADFFRYILEESLANWIVYRCINGSSPYERNVVEFMRTKQQFPYSLGVKFGEATSTLALGTVREFQRYIECWYKAKSGRTIEDGAGWVRLILKKTPFTANDLREQYYTLFNGKKPSKETVLDTVPLLESDITMSSKVLDSQKNVKLIPQKNTDGKFGYYNSEWIIEPKFDMAYDFSNEVAWVEQNDKFGLINKRGEFIVEPIFDDIITYTSDFSQGVAIVQLNNRYGMIDKSGNYVLKPIYDCLDLFKDGLARISIDDGYGFVDKSGRIVIKPIFEYVDFFSEELASFKHFTKCGYIDKKGEIIIEPTFSSAGPFINGFAEVELNGKKGYIDVKGQWYDNKPD